MSLRVIYGKTNTQIKINKKIKSPSSDWRKQGHSVRSDWPLREAALWLAAAAGLGKRKQKLCGEAGSPGFCEVLLGSAGFCSGSSLFLKLQGRMVLGPAVLLWLFAASGAFSPGTDSELTFLLPAGHTECFYQTTPRNASLEVEYQVRNLPEHLRTTQPWSLYYFR